MIRFITAGGRTRKISAVLAAFIIFLCGTMTAFSVEDEDKSQNTAAVGKPEFTSDGKPILGEGETGILIDCASGRMLFGSEETKRMYPASTTKIMTGLLAVEAIERGEISLDTQVEITEAMLEGLDPYGSNMELKEGEILSFQSLLYGLMIPSGNDAACAIAECVGKSRDAFVDMMNSRAAELGASDTHFVNPNGLHDENHYTTAADMAKISRAAMKLEGFRKIADIAHIKIPPTNKTEKERYYINTNGLLSTLRYTTYYYKGATGIKTGYTKDAGNCLVSSATVNGSELIGVIFGAKGVEGSHKDSKKMLDWGFNNFESITVLSKGDMPREIKVKHSKGGDALTLSVASTVSVLVPKGTEASATELKYNLPDAVYAPIQAESNIGSVSVMLNGEELGQGQLIADRSVERSVFWPVFSLGEWLWSMLFVRALIYLCLIGAILFILIFIIKIHRNIKRANRRRKRTRR